METIDIRTVNLSEKFDFDFKKTDHLTLKENIADKIPKNLRKIELIEFVFPGEIAVQDLDLIPRAKRLRALHSQLMAEFLLRIQEKIPLGWQKYTILFPGTRWYLSGFQDKFIALRWSDQWKICLEHAGNSWFGLYERIIKLSYK